MIQPMLGLISHVFWENAIACYLWIAICGFATVWEHAICAGMRQSARAIFIWASHQQMAPHSNSSLSGPLHSF